MIATGWSNGSQTATGAGYGIRITVADRDRYFDVAWTHVTVTFDDDSRVLAKLSPAFWKESKPCLELRNAAIGRWLLATDRAPWPKDDPPTVALTPIGPRVFRLSGLAPETEPNT